MLSCTCHHQPPLRGNHLKWWAGFGGCWSASVALQSASNDDCLCGKQWGWGSSCTSCSCGAVEAVAIPKLTDSKTREGKNHPLNCSMLSESLCLKRGIFKGPKWFMSSRPMVLLNHVSCSWNSQFLFIYLLFVLTAQCPVHRCYITAEFINIDLLYRA